MLVQAMSARRDDLPAALRAFEASRQPRTARVQREARVNGFIYHLAGPAALARDMVLQGRGAAGLWAATAGCMTGTRTDTDSSVTIRIRCG